MNKLVLAITLGVAGVAQASDCMQLVYTGRCTRGTDSYDVRFEVRRNGDCLYVASSGGRETIYYLCDGTRALNVSTFMKDTGVVAFMTKPGFYGTSLMPYLPPGMFGLPEPGNGRLMVMSGNPFRSRWKAAFLQIRSDKRLTDGYRATAGDGRSLNIAVSQTGFRNVAGYLVPVISTDVQTNRLGTTRCEWRLAKAVTGAKCAQPPSFESFLAQFGSRYDGHTVVQDETSGMSWSFGFTKGKGTFDEQMNRERVIWEKLAKVDRVDQRATVLTAVLTGLAVAGAGAFLFWRSRVGKT